MDSKFSDRVASLAADAAQDAREKEWQDSERRRRAYALERRADECGVPRESELRRVCLCEGLIETAAMTAVDEALKWRAAGNSEFGTQRCVRVLGGDPGTGKSCAVGRAIVRHDRPAAWVSAIEVASTPRQSFGAAAESWQRWLDRDLIGLDDAGTESGDAGLIRSLLIGRFDRGLITIVTTNLDKASFVKRFLDPRLADRITAGQRSVSGQDLQWFIHIRGESLRDPQARAALARSGA